MSNETDSVKARLQADLTAAMKARDEVALSTIRMLRAAIMNAEVAGDEAVELTDEQAIAVLQSEAKKRAESAAVYEENDRPESAAKERAELEVIERYLPAAMSDDELAAIVEEEVAAAAANGAEGGKAMGMVIKAVRERAGASADGSRIAALVKSRLAGWRAGSPDVTRRSPGDCRSVGCANEVLQVALLSAVSANHHPFHPMQISGDPIADAPSGRSPASIPEFPHRGALQMQRSELKSC